ncbi:MAG: DUF3617 domain-containing protein [Novosphingobium sp.]
MKTIKVRIPLAAGAVLAFAAPAFGGGPTLAMLDQLEGGKWELRERGGQAQQICVPGGRQLIQLRHPGAQCSSFVIEDTPVQVVVQYTCAGRGYGRTQIRRETNRLIQIESTGIVDGYPFDLSAEARRVGTCSPR